MSALGIEVEGSNAIVCRLCERLVAAGHDPAEPMEVFRGEVRALWVRSIGQAAKLTVREATSNGRPEFTAAREPTVMTGIASEDD